MGKLVKNTAIYAAGDIAPKLFNLITFPVLTTYLAVEDFGIISYINSIEAFFTILTFLGLKTYYLVHYFRADTEKDKKRLLGNLSLFIISLNILFTVLLFIVGTSVFSLIGSNVDFYPYIAIGVATNFFSILCVLPSALYRVQENPAPLTIINCIKGALIMIVTCLCIKRYPNAEFVLYVKLVITMLFGLYFLWITYKNAIFIFNWNQIKIALVFSLPLVPGDVAYYLSTMFDRVLIDKYMTTAAVGIYSTAATLASILNIISYGSYKAFEPHFFKTYGSVGFIKEFENIRDSLLYVVFLLGMCLCLFASDFLIIFSSKEYHTAYLFVPLLIAGVLANTLQMMYSTVLTAQSRTKLAGIISIICAVISVTFNLIFIPIIGMWSAAIANFLVYAIGWLLCKYYTRMKVAYGKSLIVSILFGLLVSTIVYFISIDNWFLSILIKIICVFCFMYMSGNLFDIHPKALIKSIVPNVK